MATGIDSLGVIGPFLQVQDTRARPASSRSADHRVDSRPTPIDATIFKAYDIRGLYGSQIDGDTAEQIGRAFVRVLAAMSDKPAAALGIGMGRDMRLTAPALAARFRAGMVAVGAHVWAAGQVGTDTVPYPHLTQPTISPV